MNIQRIDSKVNFKGCFKISSKTIGTKQEDLIWKMVGNWENSKIDAFGDSVYLGVTKNFDNSVKDILDMNSVSYQHKEIPDIDLLNTKFSKLIEGLFKNN